MNFVFRIGIWDTNGVPITNNIVYNTYESAIVVTGQNNIIQNNLVSTVYWSGQANPTYAGFNTNNDGAVQSKDAVSVIMTVMILLINQIDYMTTYFI
jgi:parallel beta-helix repeat protein